MDIFNKLYVKLPFIAFSAPKNTLLTSRLTVGFFLHPHCLKKSYRESNKNMGSKLFILGFLFLFQSVNSYSSGSGVFITPDKKIILKKGQKVYFKISSEGNPDLSIPVFKDKTSSYSHVFGESSKLSISSSKKNKVYSQTNIYVDDRSPVSRLMMQGGKAIVIDKVYTYGKNVNAVVNSKDDLSGIQHSFYSINGSAFQKYTEPLKWDKEERYDVKVYSIDNVGNIEKPKHYFFTMDLTPPKTTISFSHKIYKNLLSNRSKIYLTSVDSISGVKKIYYEITGDKNEPVKKPYKKVIDLNKLKEGKYFLKYYSIDNVSNKESTKITPFIIDNSAPNVNLKVSGFQYRKKGTLYLSKSSKINIEARDNNGALKSIFYKLDNSSYREYIKPLTIEAGYGGHRIVIYAEDNVGNRSKPLQVDLYLDLKAPKSSARYIGSNYRSGSIVYVSEKTKIKLNGFDGESGSSDVYYSINNDDYVKYESEISDMDQFDQTKFSYYSVDKLGNKEPTNSYSLVVDKDPPEIYLTPSVTSQVVKEIDGKEVPIYSKNTKFYISSTDKLSGVDKIIASLDGNLEQVIKNPQIDFKYPGLHTISVRAYDKVGNEKLNSFEYYIVDDLVGH